MGKKGQGLFSWIFGNRMAQRKSEKQQEIDYLDEESYRQLEGVRISKNPDDNMKVLNGVFSNCFDLVLTLFKTGRTGPGCLAAYITGITKPIEINENLIEPLKRNSVDVKIKNLDSLIQALPVESADLKPVRDMAKAVYCILNRHCVLFFEGIEGAVAVNVKDDRFRKVDAARIEPTAKGPQQAFVENIAANVFLIRSILKTPSLKLEELKAGRLSQTRIIVAYIEGIADSSVVEEVKKRICSIDIDTVLDSACIEFLTEDSPMSPFPQMIETERPDMCCGEISEGKVAVLVENSPFVLILPVVFGDFLTTSEDRYTRFYFATFLRLLRYLVFGIALLAPPTYIAVTTFHQEMIPTSLLITIAQSRSEVPLPAIAEALIMEVTFEILREASIRLPTPIGPAITIVGGLVIGQGAVEAGVISQIMVIVVAITGISSFALPSYNHAVSVRLLRFPIMLLASAFGLFGIMMGILFLLVHLASLRSFGVPYLSPAAPLHSDLIEYAFRVPHWADRIRTSFLKQGRKVKRAGDSKPVPPDEEP